MTDDGFMGPPWQIDHIPVEPARSTRRRGPHVLTFDSGRGWARFVFIRRTADPQIVIEELFWQ
ncbi:hypothetical protein WEB32_10380 [Streptomyces netropsis]|uniref:Uncharacterized protein n=1 Tax=Streptomyces netropsis TaxID=55404 RepID=A0A7W7PCZ8_STRNE|nr:hypothetical protein [Streptomyces netropsis]MBB4884553.1 hypothetical protein [Streptomyces netropsis]GGR02861.1 hypothetical protein GCM10010219_03560 [Streptomyces netropsis]